MEEFTQMEIQFECKFYTFIRPDQEQFSEKCNYSFKNVKHCVVNQILKISKQIAYPRPGLEKAGCQWPKAGHILEMTGKNKFELPSKKNGW